MIELVLPSAHPSPQPKREIDQFSHFCTAHGRKSITYNRRPFPPKLPILMGGVVDPILLMIPISLGHSQPIIQTASRSVQPFLDRRQQSAPTPYNLTPLYPSKLPLRALPMGDLDPIHLGPPEFSTKRHFGRFSRFCRAH